MTIKKWEGLAEKLAKAAQLKKKKPVDKEEKTIVKKVSKTKKKNTVKGKKKVLKKRAKTVKNVTGNKPPKKDEKSNQTDYEIAEEIEESKHKFPEWYIGLFDSLAMLNKKKINFKGVWDEDKWQFTSKKEFERKLFLIFMAWSLKIRHQDEEWDWDWKRLTQKDFSEASWVSRTTLSKWKSEKWFYINRMDLMKHMFSERTPHVVENLFEWSILKSFSTWKVDATAIKLWLEYIEGFKPGEDQNAWGGGVNIYFWNWKVWKSQFINKPDTKDAD